MKPYYEHAGITIYHGDCRDGLLVAPAGSLVCTDPPYGMNLEHHSKIHRRAGSVKIEGDSDPSLGNDVLWRLKDMPTIAFARAGKPWKGAWQQWLVWDKGLAVGGGGDPAHYWKFSWELIQIRNLGILNGGRDSSVLSHSVGPKDSSLHIAAKPVGLLKYLIFKTSFVQVFDPFCGSGSALLAAKELGLEAVGIEVEERFCEIAARRLEQEVFKFEEAAG